MSDNNHKEKTPSSIEKLLELPSSLLFGVLIFLSIGLMGIVILGSLVALAWADVNNFIIVVLKENFITLVMGTGGIIGTIILFISDHIAKKKKEEEIKTTRDRCESKIEEITNEKKREINLDRFLVRRDYLDMVINEMKLTNKGIGANIRCAVERSDFLGVLINELRKVTPYKLRPSFNIITYQLEILNECITNTNSSEIEINFKILYSQLITLLSELESRIEDEIYEI